jgi:hypothetical protein
MNIVQLADSRRSARCRPQRVPGIGLPVSFDGHEPDPDRLVQLLCGGDIVLAPGPVDDDLLEAAQLSAAARVVNSVVQARLAPLITGGSSCDLRDAGRYTAHVARPSTSRSGRIDVGRSSTWQPTTSSGSRPSPPNVNSPAPDAIVRSESPTSLAKTSEARLVCVGR